MNQIAKDLDEKLRSLDPSRARQLELLVREALEKVDQADGSGGSNTWPEHYFEETAGALAGERFERANQGVV